MNRDPAIIQIAGARDEEERFRLIGDFVRQDAEFVQSTGQRLIHSTEVDYRCLGADVLGQLATISPLARGEIAARLLDALDLEDDGRVLSSFAIALGHAADGRAKDVLVSLALHPSPDVRLAVAFALPAVARDESAARTLVALSRDDHPDVRDWATFAIAESERTDEETREALIARADDLDGNTRAEALWGLARRHDPRAHELVEHELLSPTVGLLVLRARDELAGGNSTSTRDSPKARDVGRGRPRRVNPQRPKPPE